MNKYFNTQQQIQIKNSKTVQYKKLLLSSFLLALTQQAFAVENGAVITPTGIYDFGAGIMPPPTEYGALAVRMVSNNATTLKDNGGNKSAVKPDLNVNAVVFAGLKMTDQDFLGGKYGYALVVPVINGRLDLDIPTPVGTQTLTGKKTGIGDVQISPVIVQWKPKPNLWLKSEMMIQAPTGDFDEHRTINPGANHWTFQPSLNMTYISTTDQEISTSTQINFNSKNKDTDYRSGIELQQDFAVGQHLGKWTVGLGGYIYTQLTDDKSPSLTDGHKSQAFALGPAVGYFNPHGVIPTVYFHAYQEFNAKNRTEGTQVALRLAKSF